MRTLLILLTLAALPLAVQAEDAGEPPTFAQAGASTTVSRDFLDQTQELVLRALSFIGVRYKWGGDSPDTGFDCSGLIRYVFSQVTGRALPGNAQEISRVGEKSIKPSCNQATWCSSTPCAGRSRMSVSISATRVLCMRPAAAARLKSSI